MNINVAFKANENKTLELFQKFNYHNQPYISNLPDNTYTYAVNCKTKHIENKFILPTDEAVFSYSKSNPNLFKNSDSINTLDSFMKGFKQNVNDDEKIKHLCKALGNSDLPDSKALEVIYLTASKLTFDKLDKKSSNFLKKWNESFSDVVKRVIPQSISINDKEYGNYKYIEPKASDKEYRDTNLTALGGKDWDNSLNDGQFNAAHHVSLAYGDTLNVLAKTSFMPGTLFVREKLANLGALMHEFRDHKRNRIGDSAEDLASSKMMVKLAINSVKNNINPFEAATNISEILKLENNNIISKQDMEKIVARSKVTAKKHHFKGCYNSNEELVRENKEKLQTQKEQLTPKEIYLFENQKGYQ